jgi:mannose-1-phosphate guanylyltransferase
VLDGVVLGDGSVVGPGNELCGGLRLWPDVELPAKAVRFSADA